MNTIYFFVILTILGKGNLNLEVNQECVNLIKRWNTATANSLQIKNLNDVNVVRVLENRRLLFEKYSALNEDDSIVMKSPRAKFVNEVNIFGEDRGLKNIIIIETIRSGEIVSLKNYLLEKSKNNELTISVFFFEDNKWIKTSVTKNDSIEFVSPISQYLNLSLSGINNEELIITKFGENEIIDSQFFPTGMLDSSSKWDSIK